MRVDVLSTELPSNCEDSCKRLSYVAVALILAFVFMRAVNDTVSLPSNRPMPHFAQDEQALHDEIDKIVKDPGRKAEIAHILEKAGKFYQDNGRYGDAEPYFVQLLHQPVADDTARAQRMSTVGVFYRDCGKYPIAEKFFENARALHEKSGDKQALVQDLNDLAVTVLWQGRAEESPPERAADFKKAKSLFKEALNMTGDESEWRGLRNTIQNNQELLAIEEGKVPDTPDQPSYRFSSQ